jgi:hypothetical protein
MDEDNTTQLAPPAMTVNAPGGDPAAAGGGTDFIGDVLNSAKQAAAYLAKGEIAKLADSQNLPNSPKNVEGVVWKWAVGLTVLAVAAYVVVRVARKG